MTIHIFSSYSSSRLEYSLRFICEELLRCRFKCYSSIENYQKAEGPHLNYSRQRILPEEVFIPAGHLLRENDIRPQHPTIFYPGEWPAFFAIDLPATDLAFDLPALVFYLLSRYEEYLPFKADEHQRFEASQSLAFQADFLHLPLIDLWGLKLKNLFEEKYPSRSFPVRNYTFLPSYDIDMAWAYSHKGFYRFVGAAGREFLRADFRALWLRLKVSTGHKEDPFYTFDYMEKCHKRFRLQPLYFFLLGNPGVFDKNISWKNRHFQKLIYQLSQNYKIGLHPSYQSNSAEDLLDLEKHRLEKITAQEIYRSRQHFLKLRFPQTYRHLHSSGIREDYTMGYAGQIGFRASTCSPFYWYDLEKDEATSLRLIPFAVMDVSLRQYLALNPEEAIAKVKPLIEVVRRVGGTFSTLWHNNSFSEMEGWEGWRAVYEAILEEAVDENQAYRF